MKLEPRSNQTGRGGVEKNIWLDLGSSCEDVSPGSGLILVCCRATHSLGQEKRKKLQAPSSKLDND